MFLQEIRLVQALVVQAAELLRQLVHIMEVPELLDKEMPEGIILVVVMDIKPPEAEEPARLVIPKLVQVEMVEMVALAKKKLWDCLPPKHIHYYHL